MKNEVTAKRLSLALSNANMIPQELADRSGDSKASISQYMNGVYAPSNINSGKMAAVLGVNPVWLMGFDVPMQLQSDQNDESVQLRNVHSIQLKKLPMLGEIACGVPRYANEEKGYYIGVGLDVEADFCLTARGDSMINARIHDGDIVFIREQSIVENGEIAAVVVNDDNEATLKRFYYYREKGLLILRAENPNFEDQIYQGEELNQVHVLGKAVAFQSNI